MIFTYLVFQFKWKIKDGILYSTVFLFLFRVCYSSGHGKWSCPGSLLRQQELNTYSTSGAAVPRENILLAAWPTKELLCSLLTDPCPGKQPGVLEQAQHSQA